MSENQNFGMDTLAIHGGINHTNFNEHVFPLFQTSTFMFENTEQGARRFAGEETGYIYTRMGNPTVEILEKKLALLEEGAVGRIYPTGMAAISSPLLGFLGAGDHLITESIIYGCTDSLFRKQFERFGIEVSFIDSVDCNQIVDHIKDNTKAVFLETPSNPTMKTCDIKKVCADVKAKNPDIKIVVDNTFATPIYQKPLKMGADIVIHSCTKYINGHGDVVAGAAVFKDKNMADMNHTQLDIGTTVSPFDAWLMIRGVKTLPLRMERHTQNAKKVTEYLKNHEKVDTVAYPGFSGMIAFELKEGVEAGKKLLNSVKMIGLAVSLGNVDSLIQHPASMTHAIIPKEQREKIGITDGLVRLSVGIENVEDIIADLDQALNNS
ncbi:aminotransferase class I/II-fold pyridoxal phosphate-dependent enzyme [Patescibacteria group bacterium]|nr:aminotransferase class I/II-fold pyridoxal phosphate-dependent enzyme [Patescibacteria group bacterium]